MKNLFFRFAHKIADIVGSPYAFMSAVCLIVVWLLTGPLFQYSDTWQLIINTATTIVTFLMVFLIQTAQNRDAKAIHLKLDELLRSVKGARNEFVDLEELTEEELDKLQGEFRELHQEYAKKALELEKLKLVKTEKKSKKDHRRS